MTPTDRVCEQEPEAVEGSIYHQLLAEGQTREARGEVRGQARSILKILASRHVDLSSEDQSRILECTEAFILDEWLLRAFTVSGVEALFEDSLP